MLCWKVVGKLYVMLESCWKVVCYVDVGAPLDLSLTTYRPSLVYALIKLVLSN